jgi:hypothetical protein
MTYSLLVQPRPALDTEWFAELTRLTKDLLPIYEVLGPGPEELRKARQAFEKSGCRQAPDLRPNLTNPEAYLQEVGEWEAFRRRIEREEANPAIRRAYLHYLDGPIGDAAMLLLADTNQAAFQVANQAQYDMPDPKIFAAACAWLRAEAARHVANSDPEISAAARGVLELIPDLGADPGYLQPDAGTFRRVRELHYRPGGFFDQLLAGADVPTSGLITQTGGDAIVRQAIKNIGSDYRSTTSPGDLWGVDHVNKTVIHPSAYALNRAGFIGIIAHEIGSHLLERTNGLRQPLRLLGLGLNHYERLNEGRALLREQLIFDDPAAFEAHSFGWRYNILLHVAISCGAGLTGRTYGFIQVYELILAVCRLWKLTRTPTTKIDREPAGVFAWHLATRALAGTDGSGGAYYKNIVYLEGNIRSWQLAKTDPAVILRCDGGKFDLTNPEHRKILEDLNV